MLIMQDVKTYNADNHPSRWALKADGTLRQTGYVVTDTDTNIRIWYPNRGQAVSEMKEPGKYGPRGECINPKTATAGQQETK